MNSFLFLQTYQFSLLVLVRFFFPSKIRLCRSSSHKIEDKHQTLSAILVMLSMKLIFFIIIYYFLPWFVDIVMELVILRLCFFCHSSVSHYHCPGITYKGIHLFESSVKELISGNKSIWENQLVKQCLMMNSYLWFSISSNNHLYYMLCMIIIQHKPHNIQVIQFRYFFTLAFCVIMYMCSFGTC